ncbi:SDR family NAD(P)-dependent oxidoreductase [Streptomyces sp. HD]|uniref:SDR family NAD(P)-dependent oxidoreductase n=1 Tax=Streptomyces sp. HD TaxID=3020892 RepID=UPI00232B56AA|nr:glucose 1-dehydrogenase [Streptomyces sp. HD]MDC0772602.1 glucose 1-dehydrogenase [Streptomyces sp. HD]
MGKLDGKVLLVSGGARGMGAAHARTLVSEGAGVVVGDIADEEGRALVDALGERAVYVHLDVTEQDGWKAAVDLAVKRFGRLDGLVNNAGVMLLGRTDDMPVHDYLRTVEVNQLGVFLGMQAVIPALRAAGGGTIVNISSTAGLSGDKYLSAYCATKFAVVGMGRVAALELGPENIRVNTVCPGVIDTDMTNTMNTDAAALIAGTLPQRRFGRPDEVAKAVLFLSSDDSSYVTGTEFVVDGGRLSGISNPW